MSRVLVIGSSGGIGKELAEAFRTTGRDVVGLSRRSDGLNITDEDCVKSLLSGLNGPFERIVVATGALSALGTGPEKTLKALNADAMAEQFKINAIGPMLVLKHVAKLMPRDRRTVFVALSARVGSIGDNKLGGWYSYRASKAALNQFIRTASIEMARTHKHSICIALHPGTVATEFTKGYQYHSSVTPKIAAHNLFQVIENLTENDTGKFFDWAGERVPW
ncbi:MAG: SDR family NAD(P)-dependent oxidoreductase [Paracoccaceae bacterium]